MAPRAVRHRVEPADAARQTASRNCVADAEPWDLVILDEAHHARRKGAGLRRTKAEPAPGADAAAARAGAGTRAADRDADAGVARRGLGSAGPARAAARLGRALVPLASSTRPRIRTPRTPTSSSSREKFRQAEAHFGPVARRGGTAAGAGRRRAGDEEVLQALRDAAQTDRRQLDTDRRRAAIRIDAVGDAGRAAGLAPHARPAAALLQGRAGSRRPSPTAMWTTCSSS